MMLVLQGVAQVSTNPLPETQVEEHCDGHDSRQDCSCCPADMSMTGGCAALCSVSIAVAAAALSVPRMNSGGYLRVAIQGTFGPAYLPLNPPPIS